MAVAYSVENTTNEAGDSEADLLNPVVVAAEKSWQYLLASHTPMSAQFLPAVWHSQRERHKRPMVAPRVWMRN